ncbi:MAG: NAD kinase [Bacteroidales bacterium]|nr:NAD kinase [Bacteroidales bacterium]
MKIAIYGKTFNLDFFKYIQQVFDILKQEGAELVIYKPFLQFIDNYKKIHHDKLKVFESEDELDSDINFIVSIGGDGTFLEAIPYALHYDVPVIGLNSGRLGFLANISKEEIRSAFEAIIGKNYQIEYRTLLKFISPDACVQKLKYALNEITIQKKGSSMITIDAYLNDEYLSTYWTDGLIVSTPTGSTAYSISVGGPIVMPGSSNLILAPIASHNLTVRPIIIHDDLMITLRATSRHNQIHITADNKIMEIDQPVEIKVGTADFKLQMLKLPNNSFYATIRNKLMWGADKRN